MMAKPTLEHKTGILQQKAHKGYLSGMMVFEFFLLACRRSRLLQALIF